jgi:hypothetical protein
VTLVIIGLSFLNQFLQDQKTNKEDAHVATESTPDPKVTQTPSSYSSKQPTDRSQNIYTAIDLKTIAPIPLPKNSEITNELGDIIIEDTNDYRILYIKRKDQFSIGIFSSPFEKQRQKAEKAFLSILNITEEKACELNVVTTTPMFANPEEAGKIYSLSFCE